MSTTPTYHCHLGAIGWDHAAWLGVFYPEDMPLEWRLSFYNTEFECVYLPYKVWSKTPLETLVAWREETLERFRFLLEAPPAVVSSTEAACIAALGEKAVVANPHAGPAIIWLEPGANLQQLAQTLQEQTVLPVYVVSVSADYAQLNQARTLLEVLGY